MIGAIIQALAELVKVLKALTAPKTPRLPATLGERIVAAMRRKGYKVDEGAGVYNIVYVEGMNLDGTVNDDAPDFYNDLRCVINVVGSKVTATLWRATTEPGKFYTEHRINPKGAARIAFGQQRAWQVGMHRGHHEALVQTGGSVKVHRDDNEDFIRPGDATDTGWFGINQHGPSGTSETIGGNSAGCLVSQTMSAHRDFMKMVKSDQRYLANKQFIFSTTILDSKDV